MVTARKLKEANSSRMVHHLSLGNAGYRPGYRCAPARTERLSLCTVKRNSRGSENRILTDVLEQQGAGPVIREQITSRHVAAVLRGVIAGAL